MKKRLTEKQKLFISEYLIDLNATAAAKRAGYSKRTAKETGYENLTKPHIKKAIDLEIKRRNKKRELKEEDIINELRKVAFCDISRLYESNFDLKDITTLPNELTAAIKEVVKIKNEKGTRIGLKLYAKLHALELLGKHLGMWKAEQTDKDWHIIIEDRVKRKA